MNITLSSLFESVEYFYLYHIIISLIIAAIAAFFLQKRFTTSSLNIILLVLLFNVSIPIVGYVLTAWMVFYLMRVKYKKELKNLNYIDMYEFEYEFPEVQRIFGEGSMGQLIYDNKAESSLRMKALVSLADNATKEELKLVKNSLSDKNDEIRLYSFAVIDKKERLINEKIHQALDEYNEAKTNEDKLEAANELVYLYWDMVYYELSDEDLKHFIIKEIEKYAKVILESNPKDKKINLTLGKMYLMDKEFEKAETYLELAIEHGTDKDYMIPYLAEIYYHKRDFKAVKEIFKRTEKLNLNMLLNPVVEQWSKA